MLREKKIKNTFDTIFMEHESLDDDSMYTPYTH